VVTIEQDIDPKGEVTFGLNMFNDVLFGDLHIPHHSSDSERRVFAHFGRFDVCFGHLLDVADCVAVSADNQTDHI